MPRVRCANCGYIFPFQSSAAIQVCPECHSRMRVNMQPKTEYKSATLNNRQSPAVSAPKRTATDDYDTLRTEYMNMMRSRLENNRGDKDGVYLSREEYNALVSRASGVPVLPPAGYYNVPQTANNRIQTSAQPTYGTQTNYAYSMPQAPSDLGRANYASGNAAVNAQPQRRYGTNNVAAQSTAGALTAANHEGYAYTPDRAYANAPTYGGNYAAGKAQPQNYSLNDEVANSVPVGTAGRVTQYAPPPQYVHAGQYAPAAPQYAPNAPQYAPNTGNYAQAPAANGGKKVKAKKFKPVPDTKQGKIMNWLSFLVALAAAVMSGLLTIFAVDSLGTTGLTYLVPEGGWKGTFMPFDPVAAIIMFLPAVVAILSLVSSAKRGKGSKFLLALLSLIAGAALVLFNFLVPLALGVPLTFSMDVITANSAFVFVAAALCVVNFFLLFIAGCMIKPWKKQIA